MQFQKSFFHLTIANFSIFWLTLSRSHNILLTNTSSMSNSLKILFNSAPHPAFSLRSPLKIPFVSLEFSILINRFHKRVMHRILLNPGLIQSISPIIPAVGANLCTPRKYLIALFCATSISFDLIYPHTPLLYSYTVSTPASYLFSNVTEPTCFNVLNFDITAPSALPAASVRYLAHESNFRCSSSIYKYWQFLISLHHNLFHTRIVFSFVAWNELLWSFLY